jgi:hypothetical protein
MISAFGVEHGVISKAKRRPRVEGFNPRKQTTPGEAFFKKPEKPQLHQGLAPGPNKVAERFTVKEAAKPAQQAVKATKGGGKLKLIAGGTALAGAAGGTAYALNRKRTVAKARRGPGYTGPHNPATSMARRGGGGGNYFQPSSEQVAAAKARRAEQKQFSIKHQESKQFVPRGGGKKVPWRVHRAASGRMAETLAGVTAASGGALYLLNRRNREPVAKLDKDKAIDTGLGAAAGAGLSATALNVGSMSTKIALKNVRAKRGQSHHEAKVWRAHAAKHGVRDESGGTKIWRAYSQYPKELPHWKAHRALAFKNRPQVLPATLAAGALAGGVYGHKKSVKHG